MWSVLPGKIIIGGSIPPDAAMAKTTVTCFFSQPEILTVTDLDPLFAKYLLGTMSKKASVSSMLPMNARGYFLIFKIWHTSRKKIIFQLFRELLAN